MVGINPSNIQYKNLTFGAQDTASEATMAMTPAQISDDPYADKHGKKFKDHRGLLSEGLTPSNKNLMPELPTYDSYSTSNSQNEQPSKPKNKFSLLKTFLVIGVLTAGGILLYKNKGNLFTRNSANILGGPPKSGLKGGVNRISTANFTTYFNEANQKARVDQNLDAINMSNLQVMMHGANITEKRQHLKNLYELGKIYNEKGSQARIVLIMPESIKQEALDITDFIKTGDIPSINNRLIQEMEGFQLYNIQTTLPEKSDIVVVPQVGHGINGNKISDVAAKLVRNLGETFRDRF